GSDDMTVRLWDLKAGLELKCLRGHTGPIHSIAVSPDGRTALSASTDQSLRVWDLKTGLELQQFTGHGDVVWGAAFTPDGRRAYSGGKDGTLRLWRLPGAEEVVKLPDDNPEPPRDPRRPVPDAATQAAAAMAVREAFKDDYAKTQPAD